jgi:hypothetical protein
LLKLHVHEARQQIQRLATLLAAEVSNLGERLRSPQVVSDRWNLLADVQEFRGKFRVLVADIIFLSACCFDSVTRGEVVPGLDEDIQDAVATRRSVTDVARVMAVHHDRIAAAVPGELDPRLAALVKDLDAFGRSRPYAIMRTPDKRRFVEFRAMLRGFPDKLATSELIRATGEFAEFAKSLSGINRRNLLVEHDREVLASCAVMLEEVDRLQPKDPGAARARFLDAVGRALELYGRNPSLDSYLRKARKRELGRLSGDELSAEVELLRGMLAAASIF